MRRDAIAVNSLPVPESGFTAASLMCVKLHRHSRVSKRRGRAAGLLRNPGQDLRLCPRFARCQSRVAHTVGAQFLDWSSPGAPMTAFLSIERSSPLLPLERAKLTPRHRRRDQSANGKFRWLDHQGQDQTLDTIQHLIVRALSESRTWKPTAPCVERSVSRATYRASCLVAPWAPAIMVAPRPAASVVEIVAW